jgi:2,3-bisphosphoglycerate-independent phosphoglycerate mutase
MCYEDHMMARVLFLFVDGVGLGSDSPEVNPFVLANMPTLRALLGGKPLTASAAPYKGESATLLSVDASMGVSGTPQSATGQASLLTGQNVPAKIGKHYGPKPNPEIAQIIKSSNIFMQIRDRKGRAALLNAYPPQYFQSINSGRRIYSAIPLAARSAGIDLMTARDLQAGGAFSVDFTGEGWAAQPEFPPAPVYSPHQAGMRLADVSKDYDLTWFDYWISDYAGHKREMDRAVELLDSFDEVLDGLVEAWQSRDDLFVLTSDHGNLEDLTRRGHTQNRVPALLLGPADLRRSFTQGLEDLTGFAPAVLRTIFPGELSAEATGSDEGTELESKDHHG